MIFGSPDWLLPALLAAAVIAAAVLWSYRLPHASRQGHRVRTACVLLKVCGVVLLCLALAEPLVRSERARPGANHLLVLADTSRSLTVTERGENTPRSSEVTTLLDPDHPWRVRAGQDFDVVPYTFDSGLHAYADSGELSFDGDESALGRALTRLASRWSDRPVAAVVLLTDGVATDSLTDLPWDTLPPVWPVVIGERAERDLAVTRIDVNQTQFEQTPVTLRARVRGLGCDGERVEVELVDANDDVIERRSHTIDGEEADELRFDLPMTAETSSGVHAFQVRVRFASEGESGAERERAVKEATLANNSRWAVVDRGSGGHRVLYVSGRPNWEFKFLSRALAEDDEVNLVGLLRIARRQPRFSFREGADRRNQLWGGFDNRDEETGEQVDEPVLVRLGTRDEHELRQGFPTEADELFAYDGLILDDIEASFFTRDQLALIEDYVGRRGGGLLVLGGEQGLAKGEYRRTPLGDLLPVYLDGSASDGRLPGAGSYELELTREGWLEPWVRLRSSEELERERLESMPTFRTLNRVGDPKPGAVVLMQARDAAGAERPALVAQRFGNGRSAALLVGDLWRWDMRRPNPLESDLGTAWRQILRWLVADVPRLVDLAVVRDPRAAAGSAPLSGDVELRAALRDAAFEAVHNADVALTVESPTGDIVELLAEPSTTEPGVWLAPFRPHEAGPHRAQLTARAEDGSTLGTKQAVWVHEPAADEFRSLGPDRAALEELARKTGGGLLDADELAGFADELVRNDVPITEEELDPVWHRWWVIALALVCLCGEWGLRRLRGLP